MRKPMQEQFRMLEILSSLESIRVTDYYADNQWPTPAHDVLWNDQHELLIIMLIIS